MFEDYYDPCDECSAASEGCYFNCPLVDNNTIPLWMMSDFDEEDDET